MNNERRTGKDRRVEGDRRAGEGRRFGEKVIRNTLFNAIGRTWFSVFGLFFTPYILSRLGPERYGILVLFGAMAGYWGMLDMGIAHSYERYIAEAAANQDEAMLNSIVSTGLLFHIGSNIVVVVVVLAFRDLILGFVGVPAGYLPEARSALVAALTGFAVSNGLSVFLTLQTGLQRMGVQNALRIAQSIIYIVLSVFFLESGFGLGGLVWAATISLVLSSVGNVGVAFFLWPKLRLGIWWVRQEVFKKLLWFGVQIKITGFCDPANLQIDKIILGHFSGMSSVADYNLGSSLGSILRVWPPMPASAITPAGAELHALGEASRLQEIYRKSYKYVALSAVPLACLLFFCGHEFMLSWLGKIYPHVVLALRFLTIGYLFSVLGTAAIAIGSAIERPDIQRRAAMLAAFLDVGLCLLLVKPFGFVGILFATIVSFAAGYFYNTFLLHRCLKIPIVSFWREMLLKPVVASVFGGAIVYFIGRILVEFVPVPSRANAFALLAVKGTIFCGIYLGLILRSGHLDASDISILARVNPFMKMRYLSE